MPTYKNLKYINKSKNSILSNLDNNLQEQYASNLDQNLNELYNNEVRSKIEKMGDKNQQISEFLNEISDLAIFQKISQIYKVKDKEFVIILTDGVKIKTNRIKDSNDEINKEKENKRYIIAEQLYFNMSKERKIDYIDLRFNDYIIKYLGDSK